MSTILLSIKPEYVSKIINNTKKYEYRRLLPKRYIDKIIIYSTLPVKKVIGEVEVLDILYDSLDVIYNKTKDYSGISYEDYFNYYKGKTKAVAFKMAKVTIYDKSKSLECFGIKYSPQSYVYLD